MHADDFVRHRLFFCGSLFASYFFNVRLPPPILNSRSELLQASLRKALALDVQLIVPQHYDILDGALHRRRFLALCARKTEIGLITCLVFSALICLLRGVLESAEPTPNRSCCPVGRT